MPDSPRQPRTAAEWDSLIEACLAAGLSQQAFCQQHEISRHSYAYRYRRSPRFPGRRRRKAAEGLAPVILSESAPAALAGRVLRFRDQVNIDCPGGTTVETLIQLTRGLTCVA